VIDRAQWTIGSSVTPLVVCVLELPAARAHWSSTTSTTLSGPHAGVGPGEDHACIRGITVACDRGGMRVPAWLRRSKWAVLGSNQ
jgi:hypothetical protein